MKHKVSSKLLVLFGLTCGIFFYAEACFCATSQVISNKSSTFSTKLNASLGSTSSSEPESALAAQIRAQRAARDTHDAQNVVQERTKSGATNNNCDNDLRKCITDKCGTDYNKCATDTDTIFSNKLNDCKKNTNCTTHEFSVFVPEIKEDKKQMARLSSYNTVLECGNAYKNCITTECGNKFDKCVSKSAGDKALSKCKSIATECTQADSGMAGRMGTIFGIVRTETEKQIIEDEKELYALRDQMRSICNGMGAMFDDRSLDCVFTVSFFTSDDKSTPMASKKLYPGSVFDCTPDWFGIDITTYKENAYRLTRAQTGASNAMIGSGFGTLLGSITSGAWDRAIDSKNAKDALQEECEKAGKKMKDGKCVALTDEEKCENSGGDWENNKCVCDDTQDVIDNKCVDNGNKKAEKKTKLEQEKQEKKKKEEQEKAKKKCTDTHGTFGADNKCSCDASKALRYKEGNVSCECIDNFKWDKNEDKCVAKDSAKTKSSTSNSNTHNTNTNPTTTQTQPENKRTQNTNRKPEPYERYTTENIINSVINRNNKDIQ